MKKNRWLIGVIVAVALFSAALMTRTITFKTPVGGQWPAKGIASVGDALPPLEIEMTDALTLYASTEKNEYVLGEPVWLYVLLENNLSTAQKVWGKLGTDEGAVSILVNKDGEEEAFSPLGRSDNDETAFIELAGGEQIGDILPVFFGSAGWVFAEPGEFTLTVVYETPLTDGKFAKVASDPFSLIVVEDEAGAILVSGNEASIEAGKFLLWQSGDHLVKGQSLLENLAERFPESPLASYIHFALGSSLAEPFMDYAKNEMRPPNCGIAFRHLGEVDLRVVSTFVRVQMEIVRAGCFSFEQNYNTALESLARAREIAGDGAAFGPLFSLISEYEQNLFAAQKRE